MSVVLERSDVNFLSLPFFLYSYIFLSLCLSLSFESFSQKREGKCFTCWRALMVYFLCTESSARLRKVNVLSSETTQGPFIPTQVQSSTHSSSHPHKVPFIHTQFHSFTHSSIHPHTVSFIHTQLQLSIQGLRSIRILKIVRSVIRSHSGAIHSSTHSSSYQYPCRG